MGRGWKNSGPRFEIRPPTPLPPDVERVFNRIRRYAAESARHDYAKQLFEYRVRYRRGNPKRVYYSQKTKLLIRLADLLARKQISHRYAIHELEWIRKL